jgi:carboxynorspermidine decarboxylase
MTRFFSAQLPSPAYVIEEDKLRQNLSLIKNVSEKGGVEIILALKAFAQWRGFPIFKEYISTTTASSPYEARLSVEKFGALAYTYSPAYEKNTFNEILKYSHHITFNSLSQYLTFYPMVKDWLAKGGHSISLGLRVNPEYSDIATDLYNPCTPGSRFGVLKESLQKRLPEGIEGFHFHCLCESSAESLVAVLKHLEQNFGQWLPSLKWLNMGGGHLMTCKGYNLNLLVNTLLTFKQKYPNLKIILEPGSAFLWQTGFLETSVVDIVENHGIRTAILNVSFTCHMPDCLEMPYSPVVRGAETLKNVSSEILQKTPFIYRLGGNSCLSGDFMGYWRFDHELQINEHIIFEDMIHYTTVKTNMFNGVAHPSLVLKHTNGDLEIYKTFHYEDYRDRMC